MQNLRDYQKLFRLTRERLSSEDNYRAFQRFQGGLLVKFLQSHRVEIDDRLVADVGCGYGGYSLALRDAGAQVVGLDISTGETPQGLTLIVADALALPVGSDTFDVVICASLIEHIVQPERLLMNLYRVTRPGGIVYLGFPPFYSPRGGHQFSPFHYLGERNAVRLARRFGRWRKNLWIKQNYPINPDSYATAYGEWGLSPLTISKFERLLRRTSFCIRETSQEWKEIFPF